MGSGRWAVGSGQWDLASFVQFSDQSAKNLAKPIGSVEQRGGFRGIRNLDALCNE